MKSKLLTVQLAIEFDAEEKAQLAERLAAADKDLQVARKEKSEVQVELAEKIKVVSEQDLSILQLKAQGQKLADTFSASNITSTNLRQEVLLLEEKITLKSKQVVSLELEKNDQAEQIILLKAQLQTQLSQSEQESEQARKVLHQKHDELEKTKDGLKRHFDDLFSLKLANKEE